MPSLTCRRSTGLHVRHVHIGLAICALTSKDVAGKTLNFKLTTPDNVTIGAWFVLSEPIFQNLRAASSTPLGQPSAQVVQEALRTNPTILYFHGNAATRAAPMRIHHYSSFTSRLRANVLVIDYRGFADSEGIPSDTGLTEDAKTAWRWLLDQGAKPEDVMLVGHSLGTGVTTRLATWLAREGVKPRGVALLAPFTNLASAVQTYDIGGFPLLQPLQSFAIGRSECLSIQDGADVDMNAIRRRTTQEPHSPRV